MSDTRFDLAETNDHLRTLSPLERIAWAVKQFGEGLFALTSAGVDSALTMDFVARPTRKIPVIHINTGFLPPETLAFRDELQRRYDLVLHELKPSTDTITRVKLDKLWASDYVRYSQMTKLAPLRKGIQDFGITALITGVRGDQTANRAMLDVIGIGNDGEYRIRPFIDWSKWDVMVYFDEHKLPRNELYYQGFESAGDIFTKAGNGRNGRLETNGKECGMHLVNGKLVRSTHHT